MDSRSYGTDRLAAQLRSCDKAMMECDDRVDVATDDVKVHVLGDLAEALRERHACIQRKIASVRSAMGLPEDAMEHDEPSADWAELHPRQRLAAGM